MLVTGFRLDCGIGMEPDSGWVRFGLSRDHGCSTAADARAFIRPALADEEAFLLKDAAGEEWPVASETVASFFVLDEYSITDNALRHNDFRAFRALTE